MLLQTTLAVIALAIVVPTLGVFIFLLWGNDFPNKRRFYTGDRKLHGKTVIVTGGRYKELAMQFSHFDKNLGRLWLAYTELQGNFTCFNSYLLTLGTLHSQNSSYGGPIYTK